MRISDWSSDVCSSDWPWTQPFRPPRVSERECTPVLAIQPGGRHLVLMNDISNPLLAQDELPAFGQISAEHVNPAIDAILEHYRTAVATLCADPDRKSTRLNSSH